MLISQKKKIITRTYEFRVYNSSCMSIAPIQRDHTGIVLALFRLDQHRAVNQVFLVFIHELVHIPTGLLRILNLKTNLSSKI